MIATSERIPLSTLEECLKNLDKVYVEGDILFYSNGFERCIISLGQKEEKIVALNPIFLTIQVQTKNPFVAVERAKEMLTEMIRKYKGEKEDIREWAKKHIRDLELKEDMLIYEEGNKVFMVTFNNPREKVEVRQEGDKIVLEFKALRESIKGLEVTLNHL